MDGGGRGAERLAPLTEPARPDRPFWTLNVEQALAEAGGSAHGLSSAEAATRLRRFGPNDLAPPRRFEALREIAHYLANPLVLILLVASGVSAAFGQVVERGHHRPDARR